MTKVTIKKPLEKITYETASIKDLHSIATLHKKTFNKNFTSLLGYSFLIQYYRLFLRSDFLLLVAKKNSKVIGFIAGVNDYRILANSLKENMHLFILPVLRSILNIQLIPHIIKKSYGFVFNDRVNALPYDLTNYNEITSFAVDKQTRGQGIGSQLLSHYLIQMHDDHSSKPKTTFITTDADNNYPTIYFYKKNGFIVKHSYYQTKKRKMLLMVRKTI